ncbi:MAG: FkbM family methyltransferase [Candidatus Methanospirareceae archaeon]
MNRAVEILKNEGAIGFVKAVGRFAYYHIVPLGESISFYLYDRYGKRKKFVIIPVNGYRMKLDLRDKGICRDLFFHRVREKESTKIYEKMLKERRPKTVLDIGANIGYYALLAGKYAEKVYAFEPDFRNFKMLVNNIKLNDMENIEPLNFAVSDREGEIEFFMNTEACNSSKVALDTPSENYVETKVKSIVIDRFVKENEISVDVVRFDTEGYEYFILKGMRETINRDRPSMFLEIHPLLVRKYGGDVEEMLGWMKDYHVTCIAKGELSYLRRLFYPLLGERYKLNVWRLEDRLDRLIGSEFRDLLLNSEAYHIFLEG